MIETAEIEDVSAEDLARVRALLLEDVEWAVRAKRWDPLSGVHTVTANPGSAASTAMVIEWESNVQGCACAIGMMCIRRGLAPDGPRDRDWRAAARFCGVPPDWMYVVYMAVGGIRVKRRNDQAWDLGLELRAFARDLEARLAREVTSC